MSSPVPSPRCREIFETNARNVRTITDRLFIVLLCFEWVASVTASCLISPRTWTGTESQVHFHVIATVLFGAVIVAFPIYLAFERPAENLTRQVIAIAQMLLTGLIIQASGGRIETHFLIFGSLAFLSFYRDWRVIATASVVVAFDHLLRGIFWPQSIYGVLTVSPWRSLEHVSWVLFEDIFLVISCLRCTKEMWEIADRQSTLESSNQNIERTVLERTSELRLSEERFRRLSAASPFGIIHTDSDGCAIYTNPQWQALSNSTSVESLGKGWLNKLHPEYAAVVKRDWQLAVANKTEYHSRFRLVNVGGSIVWVRCVATAIGLDESQRENYVWTFENVSERVNADQLLYMQLEISKIISEALTFETARPPILQAFLNNLRWNTAALWLSKPGQKMLTVAGLACDTSGNDGLEQLNRTAPLSLEDTEFSDIAPGVPYWEALNCRRTTRANSLETKGFSNRILIPLIEGKVLLGVIELLGRESNRATGEHLAALSAVGRQIAEFYSRMIVQARLKDNDAKIRAMVTNAVDGIIRLNSEGRIESVNPAIEKTLGYAAAELVNRGVGRLLSESYSLEQKRELLQAIRIDAEQKKNVRHEVLLRTKSGDTVPVELSVSDVTLPEGLFYTAIVRDVTDRKLAEKRVSEFYSTVSHELRTPLTSIRGALGLIEGGVVGEVSGDVAELVSIARMNCERLIRLINDILDLRKIEAGRLELKLFNCGISDLMQTAMTGIKGMADEAGVTLELDCPDNLHFVVDRDRIVQVVTNLVSNAIKFSEPGSEVRTTAERIGSQVRISVIDHGPGIAEKDIPRLFGKFQQLDSSDRRPTGGTGLGLAISKAIVDRHAGRMGVTSEVSKGSIFWFQLDLSDTVNEKLSSVEIGPGAVNSGTILIVEDDDDIALVLIKLLRSLGYETVRSQTLADAISILDTHKVDAVLLDMTLPDGDGLELIARLQEQSSVVPVIVLTGREYDESYSSPLLIDWLKKPFDQAALTDALARAITQPKRMKILLVEDDPSTRAVVSAQLRTMGLDCILASDGAEGISLARSEGPDLIVLDLGIPRPDGFEFVSVMRNEDNRTTPLLVYTGRDLNSHERMALSLGMTKHLTKASGSEKDFLDAVAELLSHAVRGNKTPPHGDCDCAA